MILFWGGGGKRRRAAEIGFCRSRLGGGYLLSHFRSTIGVGGLNFSVRNGKRWDPHAITTLVRFVRPGRGWGFVSVSSFLWLCLSFFRACDKVERNHTGNACICLLCSLGVCGDSLWESWVRPLGLRSDGGCCPLRGAAFPLGCLLFVFVRKLSGD